MASQPATAPGTETAFKPRAGTPAVNSSSVAASGDHPLELSAKELLAAGIPDERHIVAANAVHGRFAHCHNGRGGYGRVKGVTAFLHDANTSLAGEMVTAGHHPMLGHDHRSECFHGQGIVATSYA